MDWRTLFFGCLGLVLVIGSLAVRRRADRIAGNARVRILVIGGGLVMVVAGIISLVLFARAIPVGL